MITIKCDTRAVQKLLKTTSESVQSIVDKPPVPPHITPVYLGESVEARFLSQNIRYNAQSGRINIGFSNNAVLEGRTSAQIYDDLLKLDNSLSPSAMPMITLLRKHALRVIVPYVRDEVMRRITRA